MHIDSAPTTHEWLAGFATRLLEICPQIGMGRALQHALARIHDDGRLAPFVAAEAFAAERQFIDTRPKPVAVPAP